MQLSVLKCGTRFAKMSGDKEKKTKESTSKVIPEESTVSQKLED